MAHISSSARLLSDEPKIGAHGNPVVPSQSHVTAPDNRSVSVTETRESSRMASSRRRGCGAAAPAEAAAPGARRSGAAFVRPHLKCVHRAPARPPRATGRATGEPGG